MGTDFFPNKLANFLHDHHRLGKVPQKSISQPHRLGRVLQETTSQVPNDQHHSIDGIP